MNFLRWYCRPDLLEEIEGDLAELNQKRLNSGWGRRADLWFAWDVVRFFRWHTIRFFHPRFIKPKDMYFISNYLKTGLRNLRHNKSFALINLSSLSLSIACALIIFMVIRRELQYDRYNEHYHDIFRIVLLGDDVPGSGIAKVSGPLAPAIHESIPQVVSVTRLAWMPSRLFTINDLKQYEEGGMYADPSFFDVFTFTSIYGDAERSLSSSGGIVLTESFSKKYFNNKNPIGASITIEDKPYRVGAVINDVPETSHFHFDYLLPMEDDTRGWKEQWNRTQYYTYAYLPDHHSLGLLEEELSKIFISQLNEPETQDAHIKFQPLSSIHLHSHLHREIGENSSMMFIYLIGGIGVFLLLITCANFSNMQASIVAQRYMELGVRKSLGATRVDFWSQLLVESSFLVVVAALLSVGWVVFLLPYINQLLGIHLTLPAFTTGTFFLAALGLILGISLLTTIFQSVIMSSISNRLFSSGPSHISKGRIRAILVVGQITLSLVMIIVVLVMQSQLRFINTKPLGYVKDNIINIVVNDPGLIKDVPGFKHPFNEMPGVLSSSLSANLPGGGDYGIRLLPEGIDPEQVPETRMLIIDEEFITTYQLKLVQGRGFDQRRPADHSAYLINETAAKAFGWDRPIGKTIAMPAIDREPGPVIGVVKDFHFRSMHESIQPLVLFMEPTWFGYLSIRIAPDKFSSVIDLIKKHWKEIDADHPLQYGFFKSGIDEQYNDDIRMERFAGAGMLLAILLAIIGLYGLSSYDVARRGKEFGIRKILGASNLQVMLIQLRRYSWLILLGSGLAILPSIWIANTWLATFAYHIPVSWEIFALAVGSILLISWLALAYQMVKGAQTNSVDMLRME